MPHLHVVHHIVLAAARQGLQGGEHGGEFFSGDAVAGEDETAAVIVDAGREMNWSRADTGSACAPPTCCAGAGGRESVPHRFTLQGRQDRRRRHVRMGLAVVGEEQGRGETLGEPVHSDAVVGSRDDDDTVIVSAVRGSGDRDAASVDLH